MANLQLNRTEFGDPSNAGNVPTEAETLALLNEWVPNERLRLHMLQVGTVMKAWALEKEELPEKEAYKWWVAGVLHDADWEKFPDRHCAVIIEELEKRQVDPAIIRSIASHGPKYFGVEPHAKMELMIYVFDELSGFIHAAALIRPERYNGLETKSILKKLKTASFAAQVDRADIEDALTRAGLDLETIIPFVIKVQREVTTV
ncbi:MAG TPA: hydrolase [Flavihumibacter sp.]|nr:hydrolase [Bacteroidota bacterium]HPZ86576.1 hydrolase [Flavihumibacter sp.]